MPVDSTGIYLLPTGTYTNAYKVCPTGSAKRRINTGCPLPAHRRLPSFPAPRLISLRSSDPARLRLNACGVSSLPLRPALPLGPTLNEGSLRFALAAGELATTNK